MSENDQVVFFFKEQDVGYFLDPNNLPFTPGRYEYVPFRGPGHYYLGVALEKDGVQECQFASGERLIRFTVLGINSGAIDVGWSESISPNARS